MEDKTKQALDKILNTYSSKQEAARNEDVRRKTDRGLFLERFKEKSTTLIRPMFEKFGDYLKSRGHDFAIKEESEKIAQDGKRHSSAAITLEIYPEGERPSLPNFCPHVAFIVLDYQNSIHVYECSIMPTGGGSAGTAAIYELDAITDAIIDKHVLSVLSKAMGSK